MEQKEGAAKYRSLHGATLAATTGSVNWMLGVRNAYALTQEEVGFLLGGMSANSILDFEHGRMIPDLATFIAYEVFFPETSRRLYPDLYGEVENVLYERALRLRDHLAKRKDNRAAFARTVLTSFIERMELDAVK